jgi:hypothetical protein
MPVVNSKRVICCKVPGTSEYYSVNIHKNITARGGGNLNRLIIIFLTSLELVAFKEIHTVICTL